MPDMLKKNQGTVLQGKPGENAQMNPCHERSRLGVPPSSQMSNQALVFCLDTDQLQRHLTSHCQSIHNLLAGKPDPQGWAHTLLIGKLP